jgi:signal peptidase I
MPAQNKTRETLGCELAAEVLRTSGALRLRVTGASMLPAIWPGDVLSVRSFDSELATPGDVVLYQHHGQLIAHRIVGRSLRQNRIEWVLQGDTVLGNGDTVSSREMLGRVVAIERGSRRLSPRKHAIDRFVSPILRRSDLATHALLLFRRVIFRCWEAIARPYDKQGVGLRASRISL